jgi:hypothetical protein
MSKKYNIFINLMVSKRRPEKALARAIQGLLTNVAQSLRRFGWAVGKSVGGRCGDNEPATVVAVALRWSMAGI